MNLMIITLRQPFLVSLASVSYSSGKKSLSVMCICGYHYELLLLSSCHYRGIFVGHSRVLVASGSILEECAVFQEASQFSPVPLTQ